MTNSSKELFRFLDSNPEDYLYFLDLDLGVGELNREDDFPWNNLSHN